MKYFLPAGSSAPCTARRALWELTAWLEQSDDLADAAFYRKGISLYVAILTHEKTLKDPETEKAKS